MGPRIASRRDLAGGVFVDRVGDLVVHIIVCKLGQNIDGMPRTQGQPGGDIFPGIVAIPPVCADVDTCCRAFDVDVEARSVVPGIVTDLPNGNCTKRPHRICVK